MIEKSSSIDGVRQNAVVLQTADTRGQSRLANIGVN